MMLDALIPAPRLLEVDRLDLAAPPARVWELVRHGDLGRSPLIVALFAVRTLPDRLRGKHDGQRLCIDNLVSSAEEPGFQVFGEEPPREFAVGAIGKVWQLEIPFVHVPDAAAFATFDEPGFVKVAWSIRIEPRGEHGSHLELEVRVDATDDDSWLKFQRYFRVVGPGSRFIRKSLLASLARELGTPEGEEKTIALVGDELLPDARAEVTYGVTIHATPERIWPWLLQLGCGRAGFYSYDLIDNGGERSAREVHPDLQSLRVGDVLPATPEGNDGFEVLRLEPPLALVLGGLFDPDAKRQLPFSAPRPERFWQVTWSFALEPLDAERTRLRVRARAAFPKAGRLHAAWIRPVHSFMQSAMLRHLKARVEGTLPRDDFRDVLEGIGGAAVIVAAFATPFLERARRHWGIDEAVAARRYPGDELVPEPRWSFTHGVEIAAPAERVWEWVAQIGADRGGFYSYQWLENVLGCNVRNAETVHPEWRLAVGEAIVLHPDPKAPRMRVAALEPGCWLVATAVTNPERPARGVWASVSWLFFVEPLAQGRSRLISRFRAACSNDLATRLAFGPALLGPVSFAMDRRMLLGIKRRAERTAPST